MVSQTQNVNDWRMVKNRQYDQRSTRLLFVQFPDASRLENQISNHSLGSEQINILKVWLPSYRKATFPHFYFIK